MRISDWFDENPKAAKAARAHHERGLSQRKLVSLLQDEHAFPFSDKTSLGAWVAGRASSVTPRTRKAPPERFLRSDKEIKALDKAQDFFVTCAVSNSPVCGPALRALEVAAAECGARILVNPIRYKNPTTREESERNRPDEWWDDAVRPYLLENEVRPHPLLSLMTTRVQATSANPLPARIDGLTKARSAVFGHPQLAMRTVATPQNQLPKILYSSGAITERAYSDTLAGGMADFHHSVAAIKVEVRGDRFHLREITWNGTGWTDLDRIYSPDGIVDAPRAEAVVLGDVHVGLGDDEVDEAIFGSEGICATLRPKRLVLHDLFDGRSVNPHEKGNALLSAIRHHESVRDELRQVAEWIAFAVSSCPDLKEALVVRSNHDIFLDRWLQSGRPEPRDAQLFHWLSWRMLSDHSENNEFPNPLELSLRYHHELDKRVRFLKLDESYSVGGFALDMHGHLGPNGARGSPQNMTRIGTKFIAGHVHSPCRLGGGRWVGIACRPRHSYNPGPSGWLATQCSLNADFTTQMLHCIGGDFRG